MFIKVTGLNGTGFRVNTQQVRYYYENSDGETELKLREGQTIYVRQSVEALDKVLYPLATENSSK